MPIPSFGYGALFSCWAGPEGNFLPCRQVCNFMYVLYPRIDDRSLFSFCDRAFDLPARAAENYSDIGIHNCHVLT